MKKIKDFLKAINAILTIPEIDGWVAASDLNEVSISDEAAKTLGDTVKGLLTQEAAKNNSTLKAFFKKQIYESAKGELLGNVDTQLHTLTKSLYGEEALAKIEPLEYTKEKFKVFQEIALEHQTKKADDKTKLMVEGLQKQLEKNQETHVRKLDEKQKELDKIKGGFEDRLTKAELKRRIVSKRFAEKYNEDDFKDVLTETALGKITKEAVIRLDDSGGLRIYDPENPEMKLYIDGSEITADTLIDKHIGKYLAKSEPKRSKFKEKLPDPKDKDRLETNTNVSSLGMSIATQGE